MTVWGPVTIRLLDNAPWSAGMTLVWGSNPVQALTVNLVTYVFLKIFFYIFYVYYLYLHIVCDLSVTLSPLIGPNGNPKWLPNKKI